MDLYTHGIGDINFIACVNGEIHTNVLKNVVYIPQFRRNLYSTSRGVQRGINTSHRHGGCNLIADGQMVLEGIEEHGIYRLLMDVVTPTTPNSQFTF